MNILITAIGSMSAQCVIDKLTAQGHSVIGCDIYPSEWHYESLLCARVYQVPLAREEEAYVNALLDICAKEQIHCIMPLTDIEIDVIAKYRTHFAANHVVLCMQADEVLSIARNKHNLYLKFVHEDDIPSIQTYLWDCHHPIDPFPATEYPLVAKPCNGRSSEGLMYISGPEDLALLRNKEGYIIQHCVSGPVYTVDYVRNAASGNDVVIPRKELIRTKNGAGISVQMSNNEVLKGLTRKIGGLLNINGCVNMEFIENEDRFYLIDINPRFSAGIAYSAAIGYDLVNSHLNCFYGKEIFPPVDYKESIIIKHYRETIVGQ